MHLLASFIPLLLAFSLLAFGDPKQRDAAIMRRRAVVVFAAALFLGPVLQSRLGFLDWAILTALVAMGLTVWAAVRHELRRAARQGDRLLPR
jgi:hypothetical protein